MKCSLMALILIKNLGIKYLTSLLEPYVPESEESRSKGAGGGDAND